MDELPGIHAGNKKLRGINVISPYELQYLSARAKPTRGQDRGQTYAVPVENTWNSLDSKIALMIYQRCTPVFSVISGRTRKISALKWGITCQRDSDQIDKFVDHARSLYEMFNEIDGLTMFEVGQKARILTDLKKVIPDIKFDLSNFDRALYRRVKHFRTISSEKKSQIEDFLNNPNPGEYWPDFIKKIAQDYYVHGLAAIYKKADATGRIKSLHVLPGGTVWPMATKYVGDGRAYVQVLYSNTEEPQLFFMDELCLMQYLPNSAVSKGMVPIDALINMCTESMLFDQFSANKADGSQPPEKMVVFGEKDPGLDIGIMDVSDPINEEEQKRIEQKLNRIKRENAIMTLTGYGTPVVLDIGKQDVYPTMMLRQDQIYKAVGRVFNATNLEMGETGGDGTSGRSTSEAQERVETAKAIAPDLKLIENNFTYEIIPYMFGEGYIFEYESAISDSEKLDNEIKMRNTGTYSINEIRTKRGDDPDNDPQSDKMIGVNPSQQNQELLSNIQEKLK